MFMLIGWFMYSAMFANLIAACRKDNSLRELNALFAIGIAAGFAGVYWKDFFAFSC